MRTVIVLAFFALVLLCRYESAASAGFDAMRESAPAIFTDVAAVAGVRFRHEASHTSQKYLIEPMGAGVALADFNSDGLLDIFLVNGAALEDPVPAGKLPDKSDRRYWNRLYRNSGKGTFTDVTGSAGIKGQGYGMGVAVGDYDNDGKPDLYVTNVGRNAMYRNRGDGLFEDVTAHAGVAAAGWSTGAAFLDYDRDGNLDLFVARYVDWSFAVNPWCGPQREHMRGYCHPNAFRSVTHLLYHNEGKGAFRDVSGHAGLTTHPAKGLGVAISDFDRDGWPDILVANDSVAQQLFRNKADGTFQEIGVDAGIAYNSSGQEFAGMGADFNDYDNNGWPDIVLNALSLQGYVLFRNEKAAFFDVSDQTGLSRISFPHSGWGMKFFDFDNDGWRDVFVAQGHVMDTISVDFPQIQYRQKPLLLRNRRGSWEDASGRAGPFFAQAAAARGAAFGDFDNDGSVDIAINSNDGPAALLRNSGTKNHWIAINTIGSVSNRDGIGATVRVVGTSAAEQHAFVSTSGSYLSASDKRVHFGLAGDARLRLIEIRWPSGTVQTMRDVAADQIVDVREPPRASGSTPGASGRDR